MSEGFVIRHIPAWIWTPTQMSEKLTASGDWSR